MEVRKKVRKKERKNRRQKERKEIGIKKRRKMRPESVTSMRFQKKYSR